MATYNYYQYSNYDVIWKLAGTKFLGYCGVGRNASDQESEGAVRFVSLTIPNSKTIISATLHLKIISKGTNNVKARITGIDEDNVTNFTDDPFVKSQTSASSNFDFAIGSVGDFQNFDVTSQVQEIVNRTGWSDGNAMGFQLWNDGSSVSHYVNFHDLDNYIEVTFDSPSESRSVSRSPSASVSPSATPSVSPSPSPMAPFLGLKIIKQEAVDRGKTVLTTQEPTDLIFSSDYGTLKYFEKQNAQITFDGDTASSGTTTISHNLGYYPYVEVFVSVYIDTPTGIYEYCPFAGSGATVAYDANYKITTTGITLYGQINGISSSNWTFDFLVFIYKNNLNL